MQKPPIGEQPGKKEAVEAMFDSIAPKYDLLNRVLSAGIDKTWRTKAVNWLKDDAPARILDVATGTADVALETLRLGPQKVVGVDLSEEMLRFGREKVEARGESHRVTLQQADAANLPFEDGYFDAALVSFGVRNFENLHAGLSEIARVLRPGGSLVVLEFSRPRTPGIKQGYAWYSRHILPRIGSLVSRNTTAYEYLPASVQAFPDGEDFLARMHAAGYENTEARPVTFGIATIYKGYTKR